MQILEYLVINHSGWKAINIINKPSEKRCKARDNFLATTFSRIYEILWSEMIPFFIGQKQRKKKQYIFQDFISNRLLFLPRGIKCQLIFHQIWKVSLWNHLHNTLLEAHYFNQMTNHKFTMHDMNHKNGTEKSFGFYVYSFIAH